MSRVIVDLITKYVIIDSNDFVDELNRLQQKIITRREFKRQMKTHDKQRVFENSLIVIEFSFSRVLIITALIIAASTINNFSRFNLFENFSRVLNRRRFRILANSEFKKIFIDIQNVNVDLDDNKNDERFDYVKCCRIFLNYRRVTNVTCIRCVRQKIVYVLIRF